MNVLVTGGAGFIGSHLVDELLRRGHRVRVLDNLCEQVHGGRPPAYLNPRAELVVADVRDRARVAAALDGMEAVAHLAAAVGVAQSQYQIHHYVEVNSGGAAVLADVLANERHAVRKILVPGSMTAYGEGPTECERCGRVRPAIRTVADVAGGAWEPRCPSCRGATRPSPVRETDALLSESIYAITKRSQEQILGHVGRLRGIPTVCVRFFNVYGPRQSLSNPYTGVTAIFIARLKTGAAPVVFEDGRQTRDFLWVGDAAGLLADLLETDAADSRTLNIASGVPTPIGAMAEHIAELLGVDARPRVTHQFRFGDVRHCTADVSLAASILGWRAATPLATGLERLVGWSRTESSRDGFSATLEELDQFGMLSPAVADGR